MARRAGATDQPRPALGRRPWLAFLRRARILRRFALVMAARRVTGPPHRVIRGPVTLVAQGWERRHVAVAQTRDSRRRGLTPRAFGRALLIEGSFAHSFGMHEPIRIAGLASTGRITEVRRLEPRHLAYFRGAAWILELPINEQAPRPGSTVYLASTT